MNKHMFSPDGTPANHSVPQDVVNHPSHYTNGKFECLDVIEDVTREMKGYKATHTAQVFKYMWRWPWKNGIEDLKKARFYLSRLIFMLEKEMEKEKGDR